MTVSAFILVHTLIKHATFYYTYFHFNYRLAVNRVKNPGSESAMFQEFSTDLKQEDLDDSVQDYMDGLKSLEAFSRTKSMEDLLNI